MVNMFFALAVIVVETLCRSLFDQLHLASVCTHKDPLWDCTCDVIDNIIQTII